MKHPWFSSCCLIGLFTYIAYVVAIDSPRFIRPLKASPGEGRKTVPLQLAQHRACSIANRVLPLFSPPFWGSKIGYKARCIWYTCHFGGPRSATKPGVSDTPAILGVQDRLQSQVYLIHLPFWGSKIGYKARCIWYTCHFGGPRSATKPGVSDTPAILGVQDRLQSQVYLIHLPFWGSKIGYKARCIWYTCHFGGPRSATKPGVSDTPAILGVQDRLQSQVYLIHLPFWGSKIGYKARCIWYTCHFGGPRSATKPGVSDFTVFVSCTGDCWAYWWLKNNYSTEGPTITGTNTLKL